MKFSVKLLLLAAVVLAISTVPAFADTYLFGFSDTVDLGLNYHPNAATLTLTLSNHTTVTVSTNMDPWNGTLNTIDNTPDCPGGICIYPNQGWWTTGSTVGLPDQNGNFIAGTSGSHTFRDYFSFDLLAAGLNASDSGLVTSATFTLPQQFEGSCFNSPDPITDPSCDTDMAELDLHGVTTSADALNSEGEVDSTIFNDLGANGIYGTTNLMTYGPESNSVSINLDALGLAALNSALLNVTDINNGGACPPFDPNGGPGPTMCNFFSLGGVVTPLPKTNPGNTVPEPASLLMMGSGLSGLALMLKRRRK